MGDCDDGGEHMAKAQVDGHYIKTCFLMRSGARYETLERNCAVP